MHLGFKGTIYKVHEMQVLSNKDYWKILNCNFWLTKFFRQLWGSPCVRFKASVIAVTKEEAEKPVVSRSRVPFNKST